jgi:hypothetical protein
MITFASTSDPIDEDALRAFREATFRSTRTKELPVGATAIQRRSPIWPWIVLLGTGLWIVVQLIRAGAKSPELGAGVLVVTAVVVLARWLLTGRPAYEQVERINAPFAYEALDADKRLPLVLLRSFKDEEAKADTSWFSRRRVEEVIVETARDYGPVIAIGAPEDNELPLLGAARAYIPGDNAWIPVALEWMQSARMIVMVAGSSPGLIWELDGIIERGLTGKLVIVCPNNSAYDRQLWRTRPDEDGPLQMAIRLAGANGGDAVPGPSDLDNVIAMMAGRDGQLVFVRGAKFNGEEYQRALKWAVGQLFRVP